MSRTRAGLRGGPILFAVLLAAATLWRAGQAPAAARPIPASAVPPPSIQVGDLREWLGYLASDELQGRATYSPGLATAAEYIGRHLREWRVEPAGDAGAYLQDVRVVRVRPTSRSSVTVRVGRRTKTFADGHGVTFPRNSGGKQVLTLDRVTFAGYGLDLPSIEQRDFGGRPLDGSAVVWLGGRGPSRLDDKRYRRVLAGRGRYATDQLRAAAAIGPPAQESAPNGSGASNGRRSPEFTTSQRLDTPIAPIVTGSDEFFEFLFSNAPVQYATLKRGAASRAPLPSFPLDGVSLTFRVDADYQIVRTDHTQNVVGIVRGTDPRLATSYVAFGAHYDHVGALESDDGRAPLPGVVSPSAPADRVWNGADDDGSGSAALMALAKAFAAGPRPRRSLLFVWHAAEEIGRYGSRYFVDYPTVPVEAIVAQLNIDMVGRNRDDRASESETVYLVGSDRISSELHEVSRLANQGLERPLTLDYELNDPSDTEQIYYRSDHYSYAARGVPVIFFTTALHPDYHANTDEVSRILFDKLARITRLVFETGARLGNLDHAPVRDYQGPRAGKGSRSCAAGC